MSGRVRAAAAALAIAAGSAAADGIGAVGAVNPLTTGAPPASAPRQLAVADRVVAEERIVAGEDGLAQLMFLDQSTLTVGPNSEVVLDRFVYDPAADASEIALTVARGALRFIGGRTTKGTDAQIATPAGLIGLRGGMIHVDVGAAATRVILLAGEYAVVRASGAELTLSRPGAVALIEARAGDAPALSFGGVLTAAEAAETLAGMTSGGGGGALAGAVATPVTALAAGATTGPVVSTLGETAPSAMPLSPATAARVVEIETQSVNLSQPQAAEGFAGFVDVGTAGALRGQLVWRDNSDLDLRLVTPATAPAPGAGRVVSLNTPRLPLANGAVAVFDGDATGATPTAPGGRRIENIAVTNGLAPPGRYVFFVDGSRVQPDGTPYELTVTPDGGATLVRDRSVLLPVPDPDTGLPTSNGLAVTVADPP